MFAYPSVFTLQQLKPSQFPVTDRINVVIVAAYAIIPYMLITVQYNTARMQITEPVISETAVRLCNELNNVEQLKMEVANRVNATQLAASHKATYLYE